MFDFCWIDELLLSLEKAFSRNSKLGGVTGVEHGTCGCVDVVDAEAAAAVIDDVGPPTDDDDDDDEPFSCPLVIDVKLLELEYSYKQKKKFKGC